MIDISDPQKFKNLFDIYKFCRSEIEFEHSRINDRMNWLLVGQTFLFTALATVVSNDEAFDKRRYLVLIIISIGILSSSAITIGISGAKKRLFSLKEKSQAALNNVEELLTSDNKTIFPQELFDAHILGCIPSVFLPSLLASAWGFSLTEDMKYICSELVIKIIILFFLFLCLIFIILLFKLVIFEACYSIIFIAGEIFFAICLVNTDITIYSLQNVKYIVIILFLVFSVLYQFILSYRSAKFCKQCSL